LRKAVRLRSTVPFLRKRFGSSWIREFLVGEVEARKLVTVYAVPLEFPYAP